MGGNIESLESLVAPFLNVSGVLVKAEFIVQCYSKIF